MSQGEIDAIHAYILQQVRGPCQRACQALDTLNMLHTKQCY